MTAIKLHFTIHGDRLTDFCRTRWADEGEPVHAVSVLESAFPSFGLNRIMKILTGRLKLVGSSDAPGMTLEEDNTEKSPRGNRLAFSAVMNATIRKRLEELADEKFDPLCKRFFDSMEDEREPTSAAYVNPDRVESAAGHMIDETMRECRSKRPMLPMDVVMDPNVMFVTDYMSAMADAVHADPAPVSRSKCGWVNRAGQFFACRYYQHEALADALGFKDGDTMLAAGWVKIQERHQGIIKKPSDIWAEKKLSKKQVTAVWDWCQAHSVEYPRDYIESMV